MYFHNPRPGLFEKIIRHLNNHSYRFVSANQLEQILDINHTNEKIALISIDDGWRDNIKLIDIIRKFKVPVLLFVTTSAVENGNFWFEYIRTNNLMSNALKSKEVIRVKKLDSVAYYKRISELKEISKIKRSALTKEELVLLSKDPYITIGSHTVSHISLPGKQLNAQQQELSISKKTLEMWLEKEIEYFSYPSGDYTEEQKNLVKECKYKMAFTTDTSHIDLKKLDRYFIPRRCVNDDAGIFEALSKIYGIWYLIKK